jgi:hypothetical protein
MSTGVVWHDVPEDVWEDWQQVFADSRESFYLSAPCPACGATTLRRWFIIGKPVGQGGLWEWCSSCGAYGHYAAMVPDWWRDPGLVVDEAALTHEPEAIEVALRQRG